MGGLNKVSHTLQRQPGLNLLRYQGEKLASQNSFTIRISFFKNGKQTAHNKQFMTSNYMTKALFTNPWLLRVKIISDARGAVHDPYLEHVLLRPEIVSWVVLNQRELAPHPRWQVDVTMEAILNALSD